MSKNATKNIEMQIKFRNDFAKWMAVQNGMYLQIL